MSFLQILVILVILSCVWPTGETTYRPGPSNTDKMADEYNSLLNVDTGYPKSYDDIKNPNVLHTFITQKEITESTLTDTRATVHGHLLCSYVFICRSYMNMIRIIADKYSNNLKLSNETFKYEIHDVIKKNNMNLQNEIVNMISVLKHLGTVNYLDPLWLTYVYLECLDTFFIKDEIMQRDLFSHEHDMISNSLTNFTEKKCHPHNIYNHQYDKSDYFKQLQNFNIDSEEYIHIKYSYEKKMALKDITETAKNRYSEIKKILSIRDDDELSFSIDDLRLYCIILDRDITETLLKQFAETKDWKQAQSELSRCYFGFNIISVRETVTKVAECQAVFVKVIKYIIARTVMKYIHDVHLSLPLLENGKRSTEKLALRISQSNIKTTNETMLNNYKEIVSFLKIDQDEDLKFVAELLNTEPDVTFSDPKKNIDNETRIKNIMENCSKGVNDLLMTKIPLADPDLPYKVQRKAQMLELAELHKVEVNRTDGHEYEGMLDLFVLKSYIVKRFVDIDFDIAHSFFEFSERI